MKRSFTFSGLWLACIVGSLSVIPYVQYLGILPIPVPFETLFFVVAQTSVLYGLALSLSYWILPKTDLEPFSYKKQSFYLSIIVGISCGLIIFLLDKTIFKSSMLSAVHPPFWAGALASIYGGINEEVLLRLFLFTLIYFLLSFTKSNRSLLLWTTNILVALAFGIGHLPAAFKLASPSTFETVRVLVLNGIPGIAFVWLYFSHGFYAAALAHFITDLVIHVILI